MENYRYKVVIELDNDKIQQKYDLADTYRIVREQFLSKGLLDISDKSQLIFVSKPGDNKAFGSIGAVTNTLYRSWLKPYLKAMEWHDLAKNNAEDLLKTFADCERRIKL